MILENLKKAGVQNTRKSRTDQLRPARSVRRSVAARLGRIH